MSFRGPFPANPVIGVFVARVLFDGEMLRHVGGFNSCLHPDGTEQVDGAILIEPSPQEQQAGIVEVPV